MTNNFNFPNFQPPSYKDQIGMPYGYKPPVLPPPPPKFDFGKTVAPSIPKYPQVDLAFRQHTPSYDFSKHQVSIPFPQIHHPCDVLAKSTNSSRWDELVAKMNKTAPHSSAKPITVLIPGSFSSHFEFSCNMGSHADLFNRGRVHDMTPFIGRIERPLSLELKGFTPMPFPTYHDHMALRGRSNAFDMLDPASCHLAIRPSEIRPQGAGGFLRSALEAFGKVTIDSPELFEFHSNPIHYGPGAFGPSMIPLELLGKAPLEFSSRDSGATPIQLPKASFMTSMNKTLGRALETIGRGVIDSEELYNFHKSPAEEGKELRALINGIEGVAELQFKLSQNALRILHAGVFGMTTPLLPQGIRDVLIGDPYHRSQVIKFDGIYNPNIAIGVTQGMNSGFNGAKEFAGRVHTISGGNSVTLVYNQPFGVLVDGVLTAVGDFLGCSWGRESRLIQEWTDHYNLTKHNPHIKYFQTAHSRGAAVVYNALLKAPQEIRDHVFIVALAPAKIIPDSMCFGSINMASSKDLVPFSELAFRQLVLSVSEPRLVVIKAFEDFSKFMKTVDQELIRFQDRKAQPVMGHLTSNPEFWERLKLVLDIYVQNNGCLTVEDKKYMKQLIQMK